MTDQVGYILLDYNYKTLVVSDSFHKTGNFFVEYYVLPYLKSHPSFKNHFDFDPTDPITYENWQSILDYFEFSIDEALAI